MIAFYMDVNIPLAITVGLRLRGVDVLTAQEDKSANLSDHELLRRATKLNRVLFTFDDDLVIEAVRCQKENIFFTGVLYVHPLRVSIGTCIHDLEVIAKAGKPKDMDNRVEFLPL